ncbi:ribonuclease Z [Flammeovirgaceae bacterium SG7u.111]|nr:ribonuclease Z [Flammeovirgaceae bacterium SG7u.132]WPO36942.1 ribonuclease Z [Flammeovirgaceae bacterium SG7u.111]
MPFELRILGSCSATPAWGRHLSSQILEAGNQLFLIDCGEGTQFQLLNYKVKLRRIAHVFISHLHGDHYLGLTGLLSTMSLQGRKDDLHIHAPKGLDEILTSHFRYSETFLSYKIIFHIVDPLTSGQVYEDELIEVINIPLKHRVSCCGYLFREKPKKHKLKVEALPGGLPYEKFISLKLGEDIEHNGRFYANEELTYGPRKSCSYAYCSDTIYLERIIPIIEGVDLLYHESTFTEEFSERATYTGHSTAKQAATIADKANVGQLLLGHFSTRFKDLTPLLVEAQEVFDNSHLAIEGKIFEVLAE